MRFLQWLAYKVNHTAALWLQLMKCFNWSKAMLFILFTELKTQFWSIRSSFCTSLKFHLDMTVFPLCCLQLSVRTHSQQPCLLTWRQPWSCSSWCSTVTPLRTAEQGLSAGGSSGSWWRTSWLTSLRCEKELKSNSSASDEVQYFSLSMSFCPSMQSQKDPGAIDKIMKDLDANGDGQVDFEEFVALVVGLSVACEQCYKMHKGLKSAK